VRSSGYAVKSVTQAFSKFRRISRILFYFFTPVIKKFWIMLKKVQLQYFTNFTIVYPGYLWGFVSFHVLCCRYGIHCVLYREWMAKFGKMLNFLIRIRIEVNPDPQPCLKQTCTNSKLNYRYIDRGRPKYMTRTCQIPVLVLFKNSFNVQNHHPSKLHWFI
jgi:hypothetical protein